MTGKEFIDFLYYKSLPEQWVVKDMNIYPVAPFYRYLQALVGYDYIETYKDDKGDLQRKVTGHFASGVEQVIDIANGFNTLIDPEKCSEKVFPYLLKCFGLDYSTDIESKKGAEGNNVIYYQRKLLRNIGELTRRRGTIGGLKFLVYSLTGLDFDYEYVRTEDGSRLLNLDLIFKDLVDVTTKEFSVKVLEHFLRSFLPFYLDVNISLGVLTYSIEVGGSVVTTVTPSKHYGIVLEEREE